MEPSPLFEVADRIMAISRQIKFGDTRAEKTGTPLEISVMRFIDRNPGCSPKAAAAGCQLTSSNVSRALQHLETKGRVRREPDPEDARSVRLFPTEAAAKNLATIQKNWSELLDGILTPEEAMKMVEMLTRIETSLNEKAQPE